MNKLISIVIPLAVLSGCAELVAINNKIEDVAGQINQTLGPVKPIVVTETATSKQNIDSLYLKIKREFNFQTKEEMMQGCSMNNKNCRLKSVSIDESGYLHEREPGVYYHLGTGYSDDSLFNVKLEKNGVLVDVSWTVKSTDKAFAPLIKEKMLKLL